MVRTSSAAAPSGVWARIVCHRIRSGANVAPATRDAPDQTSPRRPVVCSQRLGAGGGSRPGMPRGRCSDSARPRASSAGGRSTPTPAAGARPGRAGRPRRGRRGRTGASGPRTGRRPASPRWTTPRAWSGPEPPAVPTTCPRETPCPGAHRDGRQERQGRPEPVGVLHDDVERARDRTREHHAAGAGCDDRGPGRGREIRAAVTGAVARSGCHERAHDRARDRPHPVGCRRGGRGGRAPAGEDGGRDERGQGQGDECRAQLHRRLPGVRGHGREKRRGGGAPGTLPVPDDRAKGRRERRVQVQGRDQPEVRSTGGSMSRPRSWRIALVWIWQTRLSVTPSTVPISASVSAS